MDGKADPLERIASALERMAPEHVPPTDWSSHPAYILGAGGVRSIERLAALPLDRLIGIDQHKLAFVQNLSRLASGAAAHDVLLWGARGMGKSALVRSSVANLQSLDPARLALVQIGSNALHRIPALLENLADIDRAFLLLIDDLGFAVSESRELLALRSLLDGTIQARGGHIRLAVTSNRRAIVERVATDSEPLHERDERDNAFALADRFGLTLGFHPCDRETYLAILAEYTAPLCLPVDEDEALAWAISRGSRSGRVAYQFACELAGRAGLRMES